MQADFAGKTVLITGGGSGIGRAAALAFTAAGAKVAVSDLSTQGGEELFLKTDVTVASQVEAAVSAVVRSLGGLDYAVNSAGVDDPRARVPDVTEEDWGRVIGVNLTGVFLSLKYEIPAILARGGGAIVNVESVAGVTGFPKHAAYTASKHGVVGLTRTAALEYAKKGIRVNALCPAYTRTPMVERLLAAQPEFEERVTRLVPLGRMGTAEEIAQAALYLCSDAAGFMTGQCLVLDGGITAQ